MVRVGVDLGRGKRGFPPRTATLVGDTTEFFIANAHVQFAGLASRAFSTEDPFGNAKR